MFARGVEEGASLRETQSYFLANQAVSIKGHYVCFMVDFSDGSSQLEASSSSSSSY